MPVTEGQENHPISCTLCNRSARRVRSAATRSAGSDSARPRRPPCPRLDL